MWVSNTCDMEMVIVLAGIQHFTNNVSAFSLAMVETVCPLQLKKLYQH